MAPDSDPSPEDWLTVKEIADELRLVPATIRTWIASGTLPAKRAGKRKLLVQRRDLDQMLFEIDRARPQTPEDRLARTDFVLAPHKSPSWPPEAREHVKRGSWFQYMNSHWWAMLEQSAFAPPDEQLVRRLSDIAGAMARKAAAIDNLDGEDPGKRWHTHTGLPGGVLSQELSPDANRPGSAALWVPFDEAVGVLDQAMQGDDLAAEQAALEALAVLIHDLVDDLAELGYPWPETTGGRYTPSSPTWRWPAPGPDVDREIPRDLTF